MLETRPIWPAGAADWRATDGPRLAEARGGLEHDLALKEASGEPAGRGLSHLAFDTGAYARNFLDAMMALVLASWLGLGLGARRPQSLWLQGAQASASWLSGGLFQRQATPRAAKGSGQPRPMAAGAALAGQRASLSA